LFHENRSDELNPDPYHALPTYEVPEVWIMNEPPSVLAAEEFVYVNEAVHGELANPFCGVLYQIPLYMLVVFVNVNTSLEIVLVLPEL
jgi:hypothetical protein